MANEVPLGIYDPAEVYLWGTLEEAACFRDALAPVLTPDAAATGFVCNSSGFGDTLTLVHAYIDPRDGRFVFGYSNPDGTKGDHALAFHPDGNGCGDYPAHPHENDEVVAFCADGDESLAAIFIAPDTGDIVVRCGYDPCPSARCHFRSSEGAEVMLPEDHSLFHLGYGGSALLLRGSMLVLETPAGELIPLEIDAATSLAVRATPDGFWTLRSASSGKSPERLSISFDGSVTSDGQYPEPPVSTTYAWPETEGDWHRCAFDAIGRVYCFAKSKLAELTDQIVRAELGAPRAEVVYSEDSSPLVRVDISYLVSGP